MSGASNRLVVTTKSVGHVYQAPGLLTSRPECRNREIPDWVFYLVRAGDLLKIRS